MSLVLADRVRETTTSTGTGTINLEGAVQGFQRFSVLGNGNTTYYTIQGSIQWEVGIGTYNANTLTRDTVLDSSSAGALVNFSGGTKDVFVTLPAEKTITSIASADLSVTVTQVGTQVNLAVSNGSGDVVGPALATDNAIARYDTTTGKLIQNSVTTIDDTGNASGILSQQFSNGSAVTLAPGKFWYDGNTGSWNAGMGGGNITQQIGEELFIYGKASATITDSPLQIIYHTGTVGASGAITFAPTIAGITNANDIIGIATEPLANNAFGRVTTYGLVRGITTNGSAFGETWADDDAIWYNPVTGNPTNIEPVAPNIKVQVGLVVKAGSGGSGSFQVGISKGSKLGGTDSNVQFGTLANNNLIAYDSTLGYWKNVTSSALGLGTVTSVSGTGTVSGLTLTGTVTSSGNLTLGGSITGFATSGANSNLTSVALTTGTVSTAPSSSTDIVNKSYADSIASGVNFHAAVQYATTAALPANTYNNGSSGVGATLTAVAVGTLTIDSYTLVIGDVGKRLLIKNEATQANNGVYTLTQAGTALLPYILTRATDYDTSGSGTNEIDQGDLILVINGTTNANTSWVEQTPLPITVGSTAIVFIQFAAIQTYTAGTGLTLTTNQFSITNVGTAGTYGAAATVPVITTNAQGQVSSVTNTAIAIAGSAVTGDITGNAANVTGTVAINKGGTGQTTQQAALTALSGTQTSGQYLRSNGTNTLLSGIQAADVPTLNQNTTGTATLAKSTSAFTTGTTQTYTAPSNTQWVKVTVVGPGGNGGAATGQRATGGGGGGVAIKWLSMTAAQTLVYTVGTASGTASTVASGTLTITTITANSGTNGTGTAYAASITAGGAGGTATNGDVNITGEQGGYSYGSGTTVTTNFGGKGGDCPGFGSGGPALALVATAGVQGNGFGAGGGGAHGNATAANGRGGIIIFEAF